MSTNKKKTRKKKRKSKIYKFIILLLIIIAMTVFVAITPIFNITEIRVNGNQEIDKDTIISLSGLTIGENIFRNLKTKVETNIKEEAYIKEVTMKRILPGTVEINVEEREVAYQIKLIEGYIYIDSQGYILENNKEKAKVPELQGMTTSEEELLNGKRLNTEDLNKLNTIIKIISAAKTIDIENKITTINAENVNEYILYLKDENKYIYLGNASNLNNKMLYVQTMLKEEKKNAGTMYINGDLNDGFKPYFREKIKEEKKKGDKNE